MITTIAFVLLCVACATQIIFLLRKEKKLDPFSHFLLLISFCLLLADIISRSVQINFVAVTNTFESLMFFSGIICLVLFIYRIRSRQNTMPLILFGGTIITIILLAIASSPIAPKDVLPPIPALQSSWLVLHVTFAFIGEAFFAVGFVAAIYYFFVKTDEIRRRVEQLTYTVIAIGYPIFTAGALIFGAIWAQAAWGSYWSWDPKETWALITWLVYTAYLHSRLIKRLRGRIAAILAIAGFLFTLFTFFGVNYLLSGLHSYA